MLTSDQGHRLISGRNAASGNLRTLLHLATTGVATHTAGARQQLSTAASVHTMATGSVPDDAEYVAAVALLSAAEAFVSAARAYGPTINAPCNWRARGTTIDDALREIGS